MARKRVLIEEEKVNLFAIYSERPDVELLMRRVQQKLRRWEKGQERLEPLCLTSLPFGGDDADEEKRFQLLGRQWGIDGKAIVHSTRPILARPIIAFQRIIRRLTWWYLEPILQQIRNFHLSTARSVTGLFYRQRAHTDDLVELSRQVRQLEKIISDLAERISALEKTSEHERER
jgi:hypothetical protein